MSSYVSYVRALDRKSTPSLFLDLNSLEKNIQWVLSHAGDKKIRIATKSVRSVEVLKRILASSVVFQGLMTFTLEESLWLRSLGFNDILIGYPTLDPVALAKLSKDPGGITLMVDRAEHLDVIDRVASASNTVINVCVDVDLSLDLPGVRFGVYRSHIKTPSRMRSFLRALSAKKHVKLVGAMGYEAQIAGVRDTSRLIKSLKMISILQLRERRHSMLSVIKELGHQLELVNGGGTGSLQDTIKEKEVTEVTVGSAFYAPVLFDHYDNFKLDPALMFATQVLRRPENGIITVLGGGYIASGEVDNVKAPLPWLPQGLSLMKNEGAGEVQTPLLLGKNNLDIGDLVIMRPAKAGEICERFNQIVLVRDGKVEGEVPTYRGDGKAFL